MVSATGKDTIVESVPFDVNDYFSFLVSIIAVSGTFAYFYQVSVPPPLLVSKAYVRRLVRVKNQANCVQASVVFDINFVALMLVCSASRMQAPLKLKYLASYHTKTIKDQMLMASPNRM